MARIYLGLGSNIEDKHAYLDLAIKQLSLFISGLKESKRYKTEPFGFLDQEMFLNSVITGNTVLSPTILLKKIKDIEKRVGRKKRFRNGPREIDIDILFYDDLIFKSDKLSIPHNGAHERYSVLKPMMDLDPDFIHPKLHISIRKLYSTITI